MLQCDDTVQCWLWRWRDESPPGPVSGDSGWDPWVGVRAPHDHHATGQQTRDGHRAGHAVCRQKDDKTWHIPGEGKDVWCENIRRGYDCKRCKVLIPFGDWKIQFSNVCWTVESHHASSIVHPNVDSACGNCMRCSFAEIVQDSEMG